MSNDRMWRIVNILVTWAVAVFATACMAQTSYAQASPHGKITIPCEKCHSASGWKELLKPLKFDHAKTKFALKGQHDQVPCAQCHIGLVFANTKSKCVECHTDVHRNELGTNCERCHSAQTWAVNDMIQRHSQTRFALVGRHRTAECAACHTNQQKHEYVSIPTDCYGCHRVQYEATTVPSHRAVGFGTDCAKCHSVTAMRFEGSFDHAQTGFPLVGAHAAQSCAACHTGKMFTVNSTLCFSCHQKDFVNAMNPKHGTGFSTDCSSCHTMSGWRPATFDHNSRTTFKLSGAHMTVACADCHTGGNYANTVVNCVGCHQKDVAAAVNPVHTNFGTDCASCHTCNAWHPASFDHSKSKFPLTGAHQTVACAQCHANGKFAGTPTTCNSCHQTDFTNAVNPKHTGFPTDCASCHSTTGWHPANFDHNKVGFSLTGAHASVACAQCHVNGKFAGTPMTCIGCHNDKFTTANAPPHTGFPTDCTTCHNTAAWQPASFDHTKVGFPLTGAHTTVACISCHKNNVFPGTPMTCVGCHQTDFSNALNPKHTGFPTDCVSCHTTVGWHPATFDHNKVGFPLTGAHAAVACAQCHVNNRFAGTPMTCIGCHQTDFTSTVNPKHTGFSTDCTTCHNNTSWHPASFDHNRVGFPLTGTHLALPCVSCHKNNQFPGTPSTCVGCHQTDFSNARNPRHNGFPTDCVTCHTTNAWHPSNFDHNKVGFPLVGAHAAVVCAQCHVNNVFAGTPMTCIGCHQADFSGATNPKHTGFSTDCTTCHTMNGWHPATFDHNKVGFPLTGAHQAVACVQCHLNGVFPNTPTTCIGCHQANFTTANAPPHTGFSTDCTTCHTTNAWQPATFDHSKTLFPLTGVHLTTACAQCHVNNVYAGLATTCVSCHQTNYNNTTNPKHSTSGFGTDCQTCHTTLGWTPSTWSHSIFPLNHGNANSTCLKCHLNPADYSLFSCTSSGCHSITTMNSKHTGVSGYTSDSPSCLRCHPNGRGG